MITTGRIRPHYFAGFSGGAKGIFPGCGHAVDIRQNHLLKADPSARLGRLDDNRCRLDIEDAASRTRGARSSSTSSPTATASTSPPSPATS